MVDRESTRLDDTLDTLGDTKVIIFGGEDADITADVVAHGLCVVTAPLKPQPGGKVYEIVPGNPQSMQSMGWMKEMKETAQHAVEQVKHLK